MRISDLLVAGLAAVGAYVLITKVFKKPLPPANAIIDGQPVVLTKGQTSPIYPDYGMQGVDINDDTFDVNKWVES